MQIDAIAGGDSDFKKELINIFLEQIPEFDSNLNSFLAEKEWEKLAREAHTAKSSVLTFGMKEAGTLCKEIQLHAENNEFDLLPELVSKVLSQLRAAVAELEDLKNSL